MKKLAKYLAVFFLSFSTAQAVEPIQILRLNKPGGNAEKIILSIEEELRINGINAEIKTFNNCKEGYDWFIKNKDKPIITRINMQNAVLKEINPNHGSVCKFEANEETVVKVFNKFWPFYCGKRGINDTIDDLRKGSIKVGIWNDYITKSIIAEQLKVINPEAKIIPFTSTSTMEQAFISNDVNYLVYANLGSLKDNDIYNCFASSASSETINKYNLSFTSIDSIDNVSFINTSGFDLIISYNTDIDKLRSIFNSNKHGLLFSKILSNNLIETNLTDEIRNISVLINELKKHDH